jgi:hypothetical protein
LLPCGRRKPERQLFEPLFPFDLVPFFEPEERLAPTEPDFLVDDVRLDAAAAR